MIKRTGILLVVLFLVSVLAAQEKAKTDVPEEPATAKKFEIEFSLGMARVNPTDIYARAEGIDTLMSQYASYYGVNLTPTGEFKENKLMIPLNVSINYHFKNKLYFRGGIDIGFNNASSQKSFQVDWESSAETQYYSITDKLSYIMLQAGMLYKLSHFDVYGMLGLGFANYTHNELSVHSEPGYGYEIEENFKGKGSGPGILVGLKYNLKPVQKLLGGKIKGFIRLEALVLNISKLTGDKSRTAANTNGGRDNVTVNGTFQQYQWNPYGTTPFPFWDVFEISPVDKTINAAENLKLNLSSIRLMIGISF